MAMVNYYLSMCKHVAWLRRLCKHHSFVNLVYPSYYCMPLLKCEGHLSDLVIGRGPQYGPFKSSHMEGDRCPSVFFV